MSSYRIWWDIADHAVDTGEDVLQFLADSADKINNWGTRGMAYWIGPADDEVDDFPLRIDIDPDAGPGAAAIRWLPDGLVAVTDFDHGAPIHVLEDSGDPLAEVPAVLVRADIDTARAAAAEYVDTGQRPASLTWESIA